MYDVVEKERQLSEIVKAGVGADDSSLAQSSVSTDDSSQYEQINDGKIDMEQLLSHIQISKSSVEFSAICEYI